MRFLFIDVSPYQPKSLAYFQSAKAQGIKGVIVKLTEGSNPGSAITNQNARGQIENAKRVGLKISAYHFARFYGSQDARNEADWFVKNAKKLGLPKTTPMVLDFEVSSRANATSDANAFFAQVKSKGYKHVALYAMASWFWSGKITKSQLIPKTLWVANYGARSVGVAGARAWQYSCNRYIAGVQTDISYDYNGDFTVKSGAKPTAIKKSKAGVKWFTEDGTFRSFNSLPLYTKASNASPKIAVLPAKTEIKYTAKALHDGLIWVRQPRAKGYGYAIVGKPDRYGRNIDPYGTFS